MTVNTLSRPTSSPQLPRRITPFAALYLACLTLLRAWRTRIRAFVSGFLSPKARIRDPVLGPGLPHHRHQYRWRFPMQQDDWIALGVIIVVCAPCLLYAMVRL